MSNYLQSGYFRSIAYLTLFFNQTAMIAPANSQQQATQGRQESRTVLSKQLWELNKNDANKLLKNIPVDQFSGNVTEAPEHPFAGFKDQLVRGLQNMIYDPIHPEQLIDKLISLYSFYLFLHKQLISYAENLLGSKNQMVIEAKRSYTAHLAYMEALKQQKILLEQSKIYNK